MEKALSLLPSNLCQLILCLDDWQSMEELRLRAGQAPSFVRAGREIFPSLWQNHSVSKRELSWLVEAGAQGSLHSVLDQLRQGFLPLEGGHRLGICGTLAMKEGEVMSFRHVSSLALRFARDVQGIARPLLPDLFQGEQFQNTLLLSPPGGGKTTLLRDCIRSLSTGQAGIAPQRIGVADERGELSGMYQGSAQRDLGRSTDVLDACPKAQALLMLLRGMNEQILAMDEITAPKDLRVLGEVVGCGVGLLCTAHGNSPEVFCLRPLYRQLLASGIFQRFVWIRLLGGKRSYFVQTGEEMKTACGIS